MEILNTTTETCFAVDEDLLNFNLGDGEEDSHPTIFKGVSASSSSETTALSHTGSFPEFVEEELEWLSNKDAFPPVETCFGILSENPELITNNHHSPKSVLENSSSTTNSNTTHGSSMASCFNGLKIPANYPVRARSKRGRRTTETTWSNQVNIGGKKRESLTPLPAITKSSSGGGGGMGRRCLHCQADKTPQWRAGPMGPKTLCNACGVRYKSGRLLPEYRPASSPTFSSVLHSNSHRKVVEMRKNKQLAGDGEGIPVKVACGYRVGGLLVS